MSADCTLTAQMEDEAKRVGGQRLAAEPPPLQAALGAGPMLVKMHGV